MTQEQFEKLPKFAKDEINTLKSKMYSLEKTLSQFKGTSETNTYWRDGLDKKPLPNNANIEFKTGANQTESVSVYVRRDGSIDVNTDSRMGKKMVIMPQAANSFYINFIG